MSTPSPRETFNSDYEYLKDFWIMSEFGIDSSDYELFHAFFSSGKCPQTKEEKDHYDSLPKMFTVYRGYDSITGNWNGFAWTPEKECAEFFAKRSSFFNEARRREGAVIDASKPMIVTMQSGKGNIDAVLLGRETEFIICEPDEDMIITNIEV